MVNPTLVSELAGGMPSQKVDALLAYVRRPGQSFYDESVTQLQHALQCARQAELPMPTRCRWPPPCYMTSATPGR